MTITAKVICDSISPAGIRLTTLQLRYPKFIHGELMTHRVFSRNASSSRAIPVERLIQDVIDDPAMPVVWGKNQRGMQAAGELDAEEKRSSLATWFRARDKAVEEARHLHWIGLHKQIVNRLIEPCCHINVVVTSTEWANFDALRRHADAQPEIHHLADVMHIARDASTPTLLRPGQWHLPYVVDETLKMLAVVEDHIGPVIQGAIKVSVARCARVSYLTHEGKAPRIEDDIALYDRLMGSAPLHASPAEHQATPDIEDEVLQREFIDCWKHPHEHGNFVGWRQYRKMLPNEYIKDR